MTSHTLSRPVRPTAQGNLRPTLTLKQAEKVEGGATEEDLVKKAEELVRRVEELEHRVEMEEGEARRAAATKTPERFSQQEIEEHMATHSPPKPWCPHCVRGKGKSMAHRAMDAEQSHSVPRPLTTPFSVKTTRR